MSSAKMSVLRVFMITSALHFCESLILASEKDMNGISFNKPRETEAFTTILLDDEAYSIESVVKKPKKQQHSEISVKGGGKFSGLRKPSSYRLKGSRMGGHHGFKAKPNLSLSVAKDTFVDDKDSRSSKHHQKQAGKKVHHEKRSNNLKKLQKRNFDVRKGNFWNWGGSEQRYGRDNELSQTSPLVSLPLDSSTSVWNSGGKLTNNSFGTSTISRVEASREYNSNDFSQNSGISLFGGKRNSMIYRLDRQPKSETIPSFYRSTLSPWGDKSNSKVKNESDTIYDDSYMRNNDALNANPQPVRSTTKWLKTTIPSFNATTFHQADVVQRSPLTSSQQPTDEKEKLENQLRTDEADDDTNISFDGNCDQITNETCWLTRQVGDVLTLSVKIDSSKNPSSFQVKWMRVYHIYDSKKGKPLEIEQGKLPWNMVTGSEGRELRLNPVTNTDIEPNCIVAKVFLLTKQRGKVLFTHVKRLIYRIDIQIIDMGKIYAGEELSINLEDFISLPERGNMLFDWNLESKPHEVKSLPSNVKVSNSGRSVVLKELKKGRLGVLNCVVYSSNRYAAAKRRFNILKVAENVKRRSATRFSGNSKLTATLKRSLRCRHLIRRSQEEARHRLEEGTKPKSRKKRFKRMESHITEMDCEPLRKKVYSRWIRSLFGEFTTSDPKLMPLEKLFELSEEGDGTLDDVIPHEVHYVQPKVRFVNGTSSERAIYQLNSSRNCTSEADCGSNAVCVMLREQKSASVHFGYCSCRPEFYGDGLSCQRIPLSNHRDKRLKRGAQKDFVVPEHLFYEQARRSPTTTSAGTAEEQDEDDSEFPPKVLAFEEEESFLLSDCIDDKDCSVHASCVQPVNGHPYCKCRPGFRGNGIFCWEIIDYVPPEEGFLSEEELNLRGPTIFPEASVNRLASRTPSADGLDYEQRM